MASQYALGVDYGTNSVRAIIVDVANGRDVGSAVWNYANGNAGVVEDAKDVNLARQHPQDYVDGFHESVRGALTDSGIDPRQIIGIGVDTTGSTPMPVDASGKPLAFQPRFTHNPNAYAWLWKDHTGHVAAADITALAIRQKRPYLNKCGGTYSSEWFWSKILHCGRVDLEVFNSADSWIELCDFVPAYLTGTLHLPKRSICAAGHKAMFHEAWGGLPASDFLRELHPGLGELRHRLYQVAVPSDSLAGLLTPEVAARCGLLAGTPVAVGAFDAHMGAVGSGVRPGTLVKIMGTSTCDIMVGGPDTPDIPGVCGVVPGSVIPGMMGIEAGQSAVGDLFAWWVRLVGDAGQDLHRSFSEQAAKLKPGESGLLALDWNNGNRTILVDPLLSGMLIGQSLHTTAAEVYRTLIEATAFGALTIIRRIEELGVKIDSIVACGGIAEKSPLTMQIYADVCNRPISVSASTQTCALGAAIFGAIVGGAYDDVMSAQRAMVTPPATIYAPHQAAVPVYAKLFGLYSQLHDALGHPSGGGTPSVGKVMKSLIEIREQSRQGL